MTKKVSRFEALAKGLSFSTVDIKKNQVANVIEKARLSAELALTEADLAISKAAANLVTEPTESRLNALADAMQKREDITRSMTIADSIKAYLEEEIEVEDDTKKSK